MAVSLAIPCFSSQLKKGIKTKRISILPPEEQYAQIINVEDYNMKEDVEHFEATQKRQQRTSNAALHKEV